MNEFAKPIQFLFDEHGFLIGREYAKELTNTKMTEIKTNEEILKEQEVHQVHIKGVVYEMVKFDEALKAMQESNEQAVRVALEKYLNGNYVFTPEQLADHDRIVILKHEESRKATFKTPTKRKQQKKY